MAPMKTDLITLKIYSSCVLAYKVRNHLQNEFEYYHLLFLYQKLCINYLKPTSSMLLQGSPPGDGKWSVQVFPALLNVSLT